MKSVIKTCLLLSALLTGHLGRTQAKSDKKMEATSSINKEVVRSLYDNILNKRKFGAIDSIVSKDYTNIQGEKGVEAFKKGIIAITKAFPDAKWTLTEVVAEGNKVFVKQKVEGTHKAQFQNIKPTNRSISNEGTAIYEFLDRKIISHQILTDRLGFLQQLGVLPAGPIVLPQEKEANVFFVDKFYIPKNAVEEFAQRMQYNRNFIKSLPGFIEDRIMARDQMNGDLTIMTIALWQNQDYLDNAKKLVQAEYEKINFDPKEFIDRLNIKMERQQYKTYGK